MELQIMMILGFLAIALVVVQAGTFNFFDKDPHGDLKLTEDEIKKKYGLDKEQK